jgi:lipid II:glycine glycyltransferase (peptidoglycan interpeptide bridge formation enzyme)
MRQIRKAQKGSVIWKEAGNKDEVISFYNILNDLYRNRIGKPLLPREFFTNFFDRGIGKYLLVWYNDSIIGGIMCPILEGKAIYEFYVCGLDTGYKEQYPSVMATWAAMEYACQHRIPLFDFMGAGSPDSAYGVREFKARFGGLLVEEGRFLRINNPFLYNAGKTGLMLLKPGNEDSY